MDFLPESGGCLIVKECYKICYHCQKVYTLHVPCMKGAILMFVLVYDLLGYWGKCEEDLNKVESYGLNKLHIYIYIY